MEWLVEHPEERLTASAIIFSRVRREIWMIGDCQCMVGGEYYDNPKPYEQELARRRADIILSSQEPKEQYLINDTARQHIIPYMLESMKQQNISYSVIDGFNIPEQYVRIVTLDFQPWEIVLASDGYPFLCPTLQESEKKLDWQRQNDPLNIGEFKATKAFTKGNNSFDDRSYIRFKV
jgi:glycerophosphoryl diester phosphodiesterase